MFETQCWLRDVKECAESSSIDPMMPAGTMAALHGNTLVLQGCHPCVHLNEAHCRDVCACVD